MATYYSQHREVLLENNKRWIQAHPEQYKAMKVRNHRKREYGITEDQFQAMLLAQDGRCAICREFMEKPCVDHDHKTGVVRGLLCLTCNSGIGKLHDSPEILRVAANYLEGHKPWLS